MLSWIQEKTKLSKSKSFASIDSIENDTRFKFNTKDFSGFSAKKYMQINAREQSFYPNLSIIDLLFNEGPMAWELLHLKSNQREALFVFQRTFTYYMKKLLLLLSLIPALLFSQYTENCIPDNLYQISINLIYRNDQFTIMNLWKYETFFVSFLLHLYS